MLCTEVKVVVISIHFVRRTVRRTILDSKKWRKKYILEESFEILEVQAWNLLSLLKIRVSRSFSILFLICETGRSRFIIIWWSTFWNWKQNEFMRIYKKKKRIYFKRKSIRRSIYFSDSDGHLRIFKRYVVGFWYHIPEYDILLVLSSQMGDWKQILISARLILAVN